MSSFKAFDFPFTLQQHLLAVLTIGVFNVYSKLCTTKSCQQDIFQPAKVLEVFIPGGLDHIFGLLNRLLLHYFHFSNVIFFQRDRITSFRKTGTKKEKPFIQHPTDPLSTQAELPQPQPFFDERSMNLSEKEIVDLFEKMMVSFVFFLLLHLILILQLLSSLNKSIQFRMFHINNMQKFILKRSINFLVFMLSCFTAEDICCVKQF